MLRWQGWLYQPLFWLSPLTLKCSTLEQKGQSATELPGPPMLCISDLIQTHVLWTEKRAIWSVVDPALIASRSFEFLLFSVVLWGKPYWLLCILLPFSHLEIPIAASVSSIRPRKIQTDFILRLACSFYWLCFKIRKQQAINHPVRGYILWFYLKIRFRLSAPTRIFHNIFLRIGDIHCFKRRDLSLFSKLESGSILANINSPTPASPYNFWWLSS